MAVTSTHNTHCPVCEKTRSQRHVNSQEALVRLSRAVHVEQWVYAAIVVSIFYIQSIVFFIPNPLETHAQYEDGLRDLNLNPGSRLSDIYVLKRYRRLQTCDRSGSIATLHNTGSWWSKTSRTGSGLENKPPKSSYKAQSF